MRRGIETAMASRSSERIRLRRLERLDIRCHLTQCISSICTVENRHEPRGAGDADVPALAASAAEPASAGSAGRSEPEAAAG